MILFSKIFDRAIMLFDDPDVNRAYIEDPVKFQKIMRPYLLNGKGEFTSPVEISAKLVNYSDLQSSMEIFEGDGTKREFDVSLVPPNNSVFSFKIGLEPDYGASYDAVTKKVTFSRVIGVDETASIEYCFAGAFTDEVAWSYSAKWVTNKMINERVIDILAHCTVLSFAEKEQNNVLEVRNVLTDTDFKIYSPANSVKAKLEWYDSIKTGLEELTGKLAWDMRSAQRGRF